LYLPLEKAGTISVPKSEPLVMQKPNGYETILVVEDEKLLAELVCSALESNGYSVLAAADGIEAIEMYTRHHQEIATVITDLGLPGMSGNEEFKLLRTIEPDVKVIVASGFFEPAVKHELQSAGVNGFIQKPYRAEEILKMLRTVLDAKSGKQEP
jgi:CheY-like chemotaxis protein